MNGYLPDCHQIVEFFKQNHCISTTVLQGNATSKLSTTTTIMEMRNKQSKNFECVAHFWQVSLLSLHD